MKIAVIGLGQSVDLYRPYDVDMSVGVNDAWRVVKTDFLVCVDLPSAFEPHRRKIIDESKPLKFYSQLDEWNHRPDFELIKLQPQYPDHVCQLNIPAVPMSHCSPFVAAAVAFKYLGATEIHIYGVDLINHPLLAFHTLQRIKRHFKNLKTALTQNGCVLKVYGNGLLRSL